MTETNIQTTKLRNRSWSLLFYDSGSFRLPRPLLRLLDMSKVFLQFMGGLDATLLNRMLVPAKRFRLTRLYLDRSYDVDARESQCSKRPRAEFDRLKKMVKAATSFFFVRQIA